MLVQMRGRRIALDPRDPVSADVTFVSHAHVDHLHGPSPQGVTLTSHETALLARERGFDIGTTVEEFDGLEMLDSGHVFGSRGVLIDGEVLYTGDFAGRPRGFLRAGTTAKCRTLIIESTYGRSGYSFPPVDQVVDKVNKLISDLFSKGRPVVLMGYPLGKAQLLSYLFQTWDPLYLHGSVWQMNQLHVKMGVPIRDDLPSYSEGLDKELLKRGPWVLISPLRGGRSPFVRKLKESYGAVTVGFTGWSVDPGNRYGTTLDHVFPLSDHCDYRELLEVVKKCEPDEVYTFHGFASEFADALRRMGYDAKPLLGVQRMMSDYLEGD